MGHSFEDFTTGSSGDCGSVTVDQAEITAFARAFDPQPMHLDPRSSQAASVGGLIASGWHTCALNMRLIFTSILQGSSGMGSPGVEGVKWLRPVRPGDRLTSRYTVIGRRSSLSKPDRGFIRFRFDVRNGSDEAVLEQDNLIMFGRRDAAAAATDDLPPARPQPPDQYIRLQEEDNPEFATADQLRPGLTINLGTTHFTAEAIIEFARAYDPQPFHLSEEGGRASHFGGLSASGWHTASAWMRTLLDHRAREEARGRFVPRLGPSPGFRDLVWRKPVLAGDRITYFSRVLETRRSASRPGWGIVSHRNYGINQRGEVVFAFTGTVLWEAGQ